MLAAYSESEQLDEGGLAAALGCRPADLTLLRLCRAPHEDPVRFDDDIRDIAKRFSLGEDGLTDIVRQGQAILRFRQARPDGRGVRQAARDQEPDPETG